VAIHPRAFFRRDLDVHAHNITGLANSLAGKKGRSDPVVEPLHSGHMGAVRAAVEGPV
jgi:hypothetical protein